MRPSTCTQALNHHVIVANNTAKLLQHVTPPDHPPAYEATQNNTASNTPARTLAHVWRPQKLWADYKHYGSLCGGGR